MSWREQLSEDQQALAAILRIATCRDSLLFADLCWPPFDLEAELERLVERRDPGIIFETSTRVFVVEEHSGELRYYAGGWPSHESRIYFEWAEGCELGLFSWARDAVKFAERFLVQQHALQQIDTHRLIRHRQETAVAYLAKEGFS